MGQIRAATANGTQTGLNVNTTTLEAITSFCLRDICVVTVARNATNKTSNAVCCSSIYLKEEENCQL